MPDGGQNPTKTRKSPTQFFLKGLAISLPPILTVVILMWIGGMIYDYFIYPTSSGVRMTIAQFIDRSVPTEQLEVLDNRPPLDVCDRNYRVTPDLRKDVQRELSRLLQASKAAQAEAPEMRVLVEFAAVNLAQERATAVLKDRTSEVYVPLRGRSVPYADYVQAARLVGPGEMPTSATAVYRELVTARYFQSQFYLSTLAVLVVVILLYFLGRFVTARLGSWAVHKFETAFLGRLPVISNVYSSVKQVTDFFFSERTIEYNRVVAIEYPRRGIWSLGFVTGDSLLEVTTAAGEPLVSVLMPTSPMPMTGFTISVPRSQVVDVDISIDQAFQFCLSCGVLVPAHQIVTAELLQQEMAKRFSDSESAVRRNTPRPRIDHERQNPEGTP